MEIDTEINIPDEEFNKIVEDMIKENPQYSKEYIISGAKLANIVGGLSGPAIKPIVLYLAHKVVVEAIQKGKIRL